MSKLEIPEIPPEIAFQQLLVLLVTYIDGFMQALTDKFGSEEALKFIRPYQLERGKNMASIVPMLGIEGKDAIAIGTFIRVFEEQILKVEGKVTEASPDRWLPSIRDAHSKTANLKLAYNSRTLLME